MKKFTLSLAISVLFLTACSQQAPQPQVFGTAAMQQTVSVAQAKSFADDTMVTLEGRIISKVPHEDDEYLFEDQSGSITVEIDHHLWNGQTVTPNDKVRLIGIVDKEVFSSKIDVKMIEKQ